MSAAQRQQHLAAFDKVWTLVSTRHYDPQLGGLDWAQIGREFRPRIERAASADEVRGILSEMLARLGQSHFNLVPGEVYQDVRTGSSEESADHGGPGLDLRPLGGRAVITGVEPGSPAARAGVQPGWELVQVADRPVAPMVEKLQAHFKASTSRDLIVTHRILGMLDGPVSKPLDAVFDTGRGPVTVRLERMRPKGRMVTLGNMPPLPFWMESRALPGGVQYLRFNAWMEPDTVAEGFRAALRDSTKCSGFVIDLRGNPGGLGAMAMGAAGWFTEAQGLKLGTMKMRGATLKFVVFPRPKAFTGPVAILVDACSASTSEIFAGGMQDLRRARVFGTRTAGAALPSVFERLPNGDGFQYVVANYVSDGGLPLEGRGVTPDEEILPTRQQLLEGRDPVLEQALTWIRRSSRKEN